LATTDVNDYLTCYYATVDEQDREAAAASQVPAASTAAAVGTGPAASPNSTPAPETTTAVTSNPSKKRKRELPAQLTQFMIVPEHLKGKGNGLALFEHMSKKVRREMLPVRHVYAWQNDLSYMDLSMGDDQASVMQPTYLELSEGALMREALPAVASKKRAQRRRDGLGVQGHCMFANDPDTISRLDDTLSLAASLAEVSAHKKTKEDEAKVEKAKEALVLAPCADTELAKACTDVHHNFEADPRVPEGCAMTLTVKKLESLATMSGFTIKGDAKVKKALHFTLQASMRTPPYVPTVHAACLTTAAGGKSKAPGPPVNPPPVQWGCGPAHKVFFLQLQSMLDIDCGEPPL